MIVTAQQPIVFIIGDDASVRDGFEDLLRSVGLGAQSSVDGGIPTQQSARSARLHRARRQTAGGEWTGISVYTGASEDPTPSHTHQRHGDIPMSVRAMRLGAIEFLTKPVRSRSCLMR